MKQILATSGSSATFAFRCPVLRAFRPRLSLSISCMSKPKVWRPTIDDVDSISRGGPAKVRGTGSRRIPHRLNAEERTLYDMAKKKGYVAVRGTGYRRFRHGNPLPNIFRQWCDARAQLCVVLEQDPDGSRSGVDRVVIDLAPLRLEHTDEVEALLLELATEVGVRQVPFTERPTDALPFNILPPDEAGVPGASGTAASAAGAAGSGSENVDWNQLVQERARQKQLQKKKDEKEKQKEAGRPVAAQDGGHSTTGGDSTASAAGAATASGTGPALSASSSGHHGELVAEDLALLDLEAEYETAEAAHGPPLPSDSPAATASTSTSNSNSESESESDPASQAAASTAVEAASSATFAAASEKAARKSKKGAAAAEPNEAPDRSQAASAVSAASAAQLNPVAPASERTDLQAAPRDTDSSSPASSVAVDNASGSTLNAVTTGDTAAEAAPPTAAPAADAAASPAGAEAQAEAQAPGPLQRSPVEHFYSLPIWQIHALPVFFEGPRAAAKEFAAQAVKRVAERTRGQVMEGARGRPTARMVPVGTRR